MSDIVSYLASKYPEFFDTKEDADGKKIPYTRCFSGVGKGWYGLLDKLCEDIREKIKECTTAKVIMKISQIKEKFALLRFYTYFEHDDDRGSETVGAIHDLIMKAETESSNICEQCGTRENVETKGPGWITTACEGCRLKAAI